MLVAQRLSAGATAERRPLPWYTRGAAPGSNHACMGLQRKLHISRRTGHQDAPGARRRFKQIGQLAARKRVQKLENEISSSPGFGLWRSTTCGCLQPINRQARAGKLPVLYPGCADPCMGQVSSRLRFTLPSLPPDCAGHAFVFVFCLGRRMWIQLQLESSARLRSIWRRQQTSPHAYPLPGPSAASLLEHCCCRREHQLSALPCVLGAAL